MWQVNPFISVILHPDPASAAQTDPASTLKMIISYTIRANPAGMKAEICLLHLTNDTPHNLPALTTLKTFFLFNQDLKTFLKVQFQDGTFSLLSQTSFLIGSIFIHIELIWSQNNAEIYVYKCSI